MIFFKESKSKKNIFGGWGRGVGEGGAGSRGSGRWLGVVQGGQSNRPKSICPFNLFEVGGITMH